MAFQPALKRPTTRVAWSDADSGLLSNKDLPQLVDEPMDEAEADFSQRIQPYLGNMNSKDLVEYERKNSVYFNLNPAVTKAST